MSKIKIIEKVGVGDADWKDPSVPKLWVIAAEVTVVVELLSKLYLPNT